MKQPEPETWDKARTSAEVSIRALNLGPEAGPVFHQPRLAFWKRAYAGSFVRCLLLKYCIFKA